MKSKCKEWPLTGKGDSMIKITQEIMYRMGFWFLIIFLFGCFVGIFGAQKYIIEKRLSDAVKLGGVVLHDKVYDLKERL